MRESHGQDVILILGPTSPATRAVRPVVPVMREQPRSIWSFTSDRQGSGNTHAVHEIKYQAHGDAKFLKVKLSIAVDVCDVPDLFELIIAEATVPQDGGGLGAVQARLAVRERSEDLPVPLYLPLLDLLGGHGGCGIAMEVDDRAEVGVEVGPTGVSAFRGSI